MSSIPLPGHSGRHRLAPHQCTLPSQTLAHPLSISTIMYLCSSEMYFLPPPPPNTTPPQHEDLQKGNVLYYSLIGFFCFVNRPPLWIYTWITIRFAYFLCLLRCHHKTSECFFSSTLGWGWVRRLFVLILPNQSGTKYFSLFHFFIIYFYVGFFLFDFVVSFAVCEAVLESQNLTKKTGWVLSPRGNTHVVKTISELPRLQSSASFASFQRLHCISFHGICFVVRLQTCCAPTPLNGKNCLLHVDKSALLPQTTPVVS